MHSNDTKMIYGSLADKAMVDKVVQEMNKKNVVVDYTFDESGMYHLFVKNPDDLPVALDYFRVLIGQPKKLEIPKEWEEIKKLPMGNLTMGVLGICVLIFGLGWLLKMPEVYEALMFGPKEGSAFSSILNGEVWRVFTPALIHFGFLHVLFNLMWWKDLGNILENTKGPIFLGAFLIISGAVSNIVQALMVGANFGGLSGVVYALLGYLWIYKRFNPASKFSLPKQDVVIMLGWFVLCLFDVFSFGVANWAHGAGLVFGMILGALIGLQDKNSTKSVG